MFILAEIIVLKLYKTELNLESLLLTTNQGQILYSSLINIKSRPIKNTNNCMFCPTRCDLIFNRTFVIFKSPELRSGMIILTYSINKKPFPLWECTLPAVFRCCSSVIYAYIFYKWKPVMLQRQTLAGYCSSEPHLISKMRSI